MFHGDIRLGDTIDIKFTSRAFATGVPTTLAGSPVISAYPGNSTTQLTAGITLTADFDGVTGLNNARVVASSGNGYAAGNYVLVITTGTVGGVSVVGEVVGSFSIENRSALMPATAGRTLVITAGGQVSTIPATLKRAQALGNFMFLMTDSTTHAPATGKTVTVTRSLDGGSFGAGTLGSVTEVANGWYKCDFATGDTTATVVAFRATATGADDTNLTLLIEQ